MGKGGCGTCCEDDDDYNKSRNHDDNFKGPIDDRSCTDIICCALFAACIFALSMVAVVAFARGDYRRIIYPTNSNGEICGRDVEHRSKLVFFDLTICARMGLAAVQLGCPTAQVCVGKCPDKFWNWFTSHMLEVEGDYNKNTFKINTEERKKMVCLGGKHGAEAGNELRSIRDLVEKVECAPYLLESVSVMGRCLPRVIEQAGKLFLKEVNNDTIDTANRTINTHLIANGSESMSKFIKIYGQMQTLFEDVLESWQYLLAGCIIGVAICLLWVLMLRIIAKIMVLFSIVFFVLIFTVITILASYKYFQLSRRSDELQKKFKITLSVGHYFQLYTTWLIIAIVAGSFLILMIILLIFFRQRIRIAIAIIEQASKSIGHMMTVLLFPLIPFLLQLFLLIFFLATAIHISSMGQPEMRKIDSEEMLNANFSSLSYSDAQYKIDNMLQKYTPCNPNKNGTFSKVCRFVKYGDDSVSTSLQLFNIFMFLWLSNFVDALCQMTLAGAFASYYFTLNKKDDLPAFPLIGALWRCVRYHLGSIAFGALLLSIIQFIRMILERLQRELKTSESPVAEFFLKCLRCCFWCLEKCVKFFNRNAYIMIAIYGRNFCTAGRDAFFLILRNILRVTVVDWTADYIIFFSKLSIVGLIAPLFYFFFNGALGQKVSLIDSLTPKDMENHFAVVLIIVVFTYYCACLFLSVYDMGVDTLFLCFLEDLERNDGSSKNPYFMPKSLMLILGKENEAPLLEKEAVKVNAADAGEDAAMVEEAL